MKGLWWMKKESTLSKMISTAGEKAAYDNACKKLLSNKAILAWILKSCLKEYKDCTVQEIAGYIEGEPQISTVAVHQDEAPESQQISGMNTEDSSITEGTVTYDIRFRALAPSSGDMIRLIINVEAQNDFYPGYPVITRGIYYCCRLVSSQHGTVFSNSDYGKIQKVYSIFICMNPPGYRKNTINRYSIKEEKLFGDAEEDTSSYDLMTAVIICLGDSDDNPPGILKLLEVLLSSDRKPDEKKHILQDEFSISMTRELSREVLHMCNLSDGVERKGIEKGIKQGMQQGLTQGKDSALLDSIRNLMKNLKFTAIQAMDALDIPEEKRHDFSSQLKKDT